MGYSVTNGFSNIFSRHYVDLALLTAFGVNGGWLEKGLVFLQFVLTYNQYYNFNCDRLFQTMAKFISAALMITFGTSLQNVFLCLTFHLFAQSTKLRDRATVEKAFISFIITDGLFHFSEFHIFTDFLFSFLIYGAVGSLFLESSFKRFLATNIVFLCTIGYFFVAYWSFICFLVQVKWWLLLTVTAKIVFGILIINLSKRVIQTRNIVVRKYFHFLAFFIFAQMIEKEV